MEEQIQATQPEQQVQPETPKVEPAKEASPKKDFLTPALVFIALFFAFFVLITMQRLSKNYTNPDVPAPVIMENIESTGTNKGPEEMMQEDSEKDVITVGDELLMEVSTAGSSDEDSMLDSAGLDELAE